MRRIFLNRLARASAAAPLALASCLVHAFDITATAAADAAEAPADGSPVMPDRRPGQATQARPRLQAGGLSLDDSGAQYRSESQNQRLSMTVGRDWGPSGGVRVGIDYARLLGDSWAAGFNAVTGLEQHEVVLNGLYSPGKNLHFGASLGWLQETESYRFHSGPANVAVDQGSALLRAIQRFDEGSWLTELNAKVYVARARRPDVPDAVMIEDSPTQIRILVDPREISPGRLTGFSLGVGLVPWSNAEFKLSLGRETLNYRFQDGSGEKDSRTTTDLSYTHTLSGCWELQSSVGTGVGGNRAAFGLRHGIWNVSLSHDGGARGMASRTRLQAGIEVPLGSAQARCSGMGPRRATDIRRLDEVFQRPRELPTRVFAKVDLTAVPELMAALDKAGLPGVTVSATPEALVLRLPVAPSSVTGLVINGAVVSNMGSDGRPLVWIQDSALYIGVSRLPNPGAGVTVPASAFLVLVDTSLSRVDFNIQGR